MTTTGPIAVREGQGDSISSKPASGLLALISVARRLGIHLDARRLSQEGRSSNGLFSPSDLMRCADSAGLRATGIRPGWNGLAGLMKSQPAIAMLKDGEAMILVRAEFGKTGQRVILQDPCVGEEILLSVDRDAFNNIWTGELILLQRQTSSEAVDQVFNIMLIVKLIFRERNMVRDIMISALMMSLLALTPILFYRIAYERIVPYRAMSTLIVVCLVVGVLICFEVAFSTLRQHLLLRLTTKIDVKLSVIMFTHVLNLPVSYFERTPAGLTLHKMGQISRIRKFIVGQLFGTMLDAGILLFFLPVMFLFSPILTGVVLAIAAMICGWIVFMLPIFRAKSSAVESAEAQRGAFLAQSIQGIRTVKSLALETRQVQEWDRLTAQLARLRFEEGYIGSIIQAVVIPLQKVMVTGTFGLGVYLALAGSSIIDISTLFIFMLLSQRLAAPLIQASQLIEQYDEARTAVGIVGSLVNQVPEEGRAGDGVLNNIKGYIELSNVVFQYRGASKPALKDISIEIPQGTTLGIMGRSGSGKTTITRLLQRLNTEYSGLVKVDGIDVRNYDLTHFRSSLGVVLQENFLFSGTIRSNITMAKPEASFEEIVHAARLAGAEEFIEKLPNGYETYVYEGSPNLSGGQRQRLAIARALIIDPKILILDEATSALDAESEAIVNANIERISQGRTVITISHRLASLVKADAILVMEQGEVNDIGKHHELLERNEIYANLWYTQNPHTAVPTAPRPQLGFRGPQSVA